MFRGLGTILESGNMYRKAFRNYKPLSFCMYSDEMALESFPVVDVEFLKWNDA